MNYTATTWANRPSTTSPINASNLNKIEDGITQLTTNTKTTTIVNASDTDYDYTSGSSYGRITFGGASWTTARNFLVSTDERMFFFYNTEGFTATVKTSSGTGIGVASGAKKLLWCDGTNVLSPADDLGVLVSDVNVFTAAQRSTQHNLTWSAAITWDLSASNGNYLDTTAATSNWTMAASNIGTDMQGGTLIIEVNATYTVSSWSSDFVNAPALLSTTGTYDFIPYQIFNGKIYLGNLLNA